MATTKTKNSRLFSILTRDDKTITKDRANRISTAVTTSFQKKVLDKEGEIQKMEDKRERLLDMSSSNQTTTRNAVDNLEADGFVDEICRLELEIELAERELAIICRAKENLVG